MTGNKLTKRQINALRQAERFIPDDVQKEILASGPCFYCGSMRPDEVDHVIPFSRGGTSDRSNLVPSCRPCNREKNDRYPDEWMHGRLAKGLSWPPNPRDAFTRYLLADGMAGEFTAEDIMELRANPAARRILGLIEAATRSADVWKAVASLINRQDEGSGSDGAASAEASKHEIHRGER